MQSKYDILRENGQDQQKISQELAHVMEEFLSPLLQELNRILDVRLVRTTVMCCVAILRVMNNMHGFLLSELGSYVNGYQGLSISAPAGTKRLEKLIRCVKWDVFSIDIYFSDEADKQVKHLKEAKKRVFLHLGWKCDRRA